MFRKKLSEIIQKLLNYYFLAIHDVKTLAGLSHALTIEVIYWSCSNFFPIYCYLFTYIGGLATKVEAKE